MMFQSHEKAPTITVKGPTELGRFLLDMLRVKEETQIYCYTLGSKGIILTTDSEVFQDGHAVKIITSGSPENAVTDEKIASLVKEKLALKPNSRLHWRHTLSGLLILSADRSVDEVLGE